MKKFITFVLFVALIFAHGDIVADGKVLCISDIHFDPFYDTTLVQSLITSPSKDWKSVFESSKDKSLGKFSVDANYFLVKSLMNELSKKKDEMDLIYISGDFISHDFVDNFYKYSGDNSETAMRDFIEKTIKFLKDMFDEYIPGVPVIPALGNNDSYCGDYMLEPNGDFIKMFYECWNDRIPGDIDYSKKAAMGYFDLYFPAGSKNRIVVLSTVYFSPKYDDKCGHSKINPAEKQFEWLEQILAESKERGDFVNLLYHIAPGADIYSTIKKNPDCKGEVVLQWKNEYTVRFSELIYDYKETVNTQIAGHIHRDDFRVFQKSGVPYSFIHLNPAVSPIYWNNPSYQILHVDLNSFTIKNAETFYLNLPEEDGVWINEYNFNIAYNENGINKNSLWNVSNRIESDINVRQRYFQYYTSFLETGLENLEDEWKAYWCGITQLELSDYEECYCE